MALSDVVQGSVDNALGILDSFRVPIVYKRTDDLIYNSDTDSYSGTDINLSLRAMQVKIKDEERESLFPQVPKSGYETRKLIISKSDFPVGFEPDVQDFINLEGSDFQVIKVHTVPAKSIYLIFIGRAS